MSRHIHTERHTDVETWDEALFLACLDYELARGQNITVDNYIIYNDDEASDHQDNTVFRVDDLDFRTLPDGDWGLRNKICSDHLDPVWDLEVMVDEPGSAAEDLDGIRYCYGPSYRVLEAVKKRIVSAGYRDGALPR